MILNSRKVKSGITRSNRDLDFPISEVVLDLMSVMPDSSLLWSAGLTLKTL